MRRTLARCVGIGLAFGAVAVGDPPFFAGLGDLPGGLRAGSARAVSPDGSVVIGESFSDLGMQPFAWTQAGGMKPLDVLPTGQSWVRMTGASEGGGLIVGFAGAAGTNMVTALRWSLSGSLTTLLGRPGTMHEEAWGVSYDGSVIAGWIPTNQAGRWDAPFNTYLTALDGSFARARGVSGDGHTVVGAGFTGNRWEPTRWVDFGLMQGLVV